MRIPIGVKSLFLAPLILLFAVSACSRGGKAPEAKPQAREPVHYTGKLKVQVLPEVPTSAEDLQALYAGSGEAAYRWEKNGQVVEGEQGPRLARKWFVRGDRITAVVTANGEEGRASLVIENAPPQVASVAVTPENLCRGVDISAVPGGTDADGDPISYSFRWFVNGQEAPEDTPVLKADRFRRGDGVSLKVRPHDGFGAGREYATQTFVIPNALPCFVSTPPTAFNGTTYAYDVRAEDPDGDGIRYALVTAPPGMTINGSTGRIEWQVAGQSRNYTIDIEAKDGTGATAYQKYTLAVTVP